MSLHESRPSTYAKVSEILRLRDDTGANADDVMVIVHFSGHGRKSKVGHIRQSRVSQSKALFPLVPFASLDLELRSNIRWQK